MLVRERVCAYVRARIIIEERRRERETKHEKDHMKRDIGEMSQLENRVRDLCK